MITGLLRSKGICVSKGNNFSLKRPDPASHQIRHETAVRLLNPKCYNADYFGHKVHMDQNEKLKMFGVTHVSARDDNSGMIVAFSTMLVKNNLIIYNNNLIIYNNNLTIYNNILEWHADYRVKYV